MSAQVQVNLEPEQARQAELFSAQFPFFKKAFANASLPSEDLASVIPTRTSAFSNRRHYRESQAVPLLNFLSPAIQIAGTIPLAFQPEEEEKERANRAIPFHLQFAEADPFKGGRPLELTGGYDPQAQQWAFTGDAAPSWSWIGGYDTVVCSRDVVVYTSSKEWCSAGGRTDVMWDDSLEDVIQTDNDMP